MKKILIRFGTLVASVAVICGCNNKNPEVANDVLAAENARIVEMCPVNWSVLDNLTDSMNVRRDSIEYALSLNDTDLVSRELTEWEGFYMYYLYNVFREVNIRFHQDTIYKEAVGFIRQHPHSYWKFAHSMHGANLKGLNDIIDYTLWRSEQEVKVSEQILN